MTIPSLYVVKCVIVYTTVIWQLCDELQAAHQSGENEVNLSIFGGNYTVDFEAMQQINDDTGTARHVQRKVNPLAVTSTGASQFC